MMMRRWMKGLGAAALGMMGLGGAASAGTVYGIDNASRIIKVDTVTKTETVVAATGLGGSANGLALDTNANRLLFRSPDASALRAFDLTTNLLTTVATATPLPGSSASAAYYANAYWYVQNNTDDLVKVDLSTPTATVTKFLDFDGSAASSYGFGDIVISTQGMLYGSSSRGFFSLDVSGPTPGVFTLLNSRTPQLQLAMLGDGSIIGQQHDGTNAGKWYNVSLTGSTTLIPNFQTAPLRDLASSAVPEPGSIAMMGLGGLAVLALARRKSRLAA